MQKCLNLKSRVTFKWWLGFFIGGKDTHRKSNVLSFRFLLLGKMLPIMKSISHYLYTRVGV